MLAKAVKIDGRRGERSYFRPLRVAAAGATHAGRSGDARGRGLSCRDLTLPGHPLRNLFPQRELWVVAASGPVVFARDAGRHDRLRSVRYGVAQERPRVSGAVRGELPGRGPTDGDRLLRHTGELPRARHLGLEFSVFAHPHGAGAGGVLPDCRWRHVEAPCSRARERIPRGRGRRAVKQARLARRISSGRLRIVRRRAAGAGQVQVAWRLQCLALSRRAAQNRRDRGRSEGQAQRTLSHVQASGVQA